TALLLARHGVRSAVAERHPGTSILPRATGINVRTMEILRGLGLGLGLGLEPALRGGEGDVRGLLVLTDLETLARPLLHTAPNLNLRGPEDHAWPSPTRQGFCGQDVLEALLVDRIRDSAAFEIWLVMIGIATSVKQSLRSIRRLARPTRIATPKVPRHQST